MHPSERQKCDGADQEALPSYACGLRSEEVSELTRAMSPRLHFNKIAFLMIKVEAVFDRSVGSDSSLIEWLLGFE